MSARDLYNNTDAAVSLPLLTRTAAEDGEAVDLQGFEGALVLFAVGEYADGAFAFAIEESDAADDGFTPVAAADLQGTPPTLSDYDLDDSVVRVGYLGGKRYLRVVVTEVGASAGATFAALVVRGFPRKAPLAA